MIDPALSTVGNEVLDTGEELFEKLVQDCVALDLKPYTVWRENWDQISSVVGITAFDEAVKRRRNDPVSPLRMKKGRGDVIPQQLIDSIRNDKYKDLAGE